MRKTPQFSILMNLKSPEEQQAYLSQFTFPDPPEPPTPEEIKRSLDLRMLQLGIPENKIMATIDGIRKSVWEPVKELLDNNDSIFFFGPVGSGKTCIFSCIMREYLKLSRPRLRYISICDFAMSISKNIQNEYNYVQTIEDLQQQDVLMLDDLGAIKLNESQKTAMILLLNKICEQSSQLLIASNCSINEIDSMIDERIGSRLKEKCAYLILKGKDRRSRENYARRK